MLIFWLSIESSGHEAQHIWERYVTNGECLLRSTDEPLDANEAVNSYQERDDHREVVSHPEDVGGTSLAKQVWRGPTMTIILEAFANLAILAFVITSMLAMGLSLTTKQIIELMPIAGEIGKRRQAT